MEIKLLKEELECVPDGSGAFILNEIGYLDHYPELYHMKNSGKNLMFKIVKLKTGDIYYVANFVRTKATIQPKIINHYNSKYHKYENINATTIQCNRVYHMVSQVYIIV